MDSVFVRISQHRIVTQELALTQATLRLQHLSPGSRCERLDCQKPIDTGCSKHGLNAFAKCIDTKERSESHYPTATLNSRGKHPLSTANLLGSCECADNVFGGSASEPLNLPGTSKSPISSSNYSATALPKRIPPSSANCAKSASITWPFSIARNPSAAPCRPRTWSKPSMVSSKSCAATAAAISIPRTS